MGYWQDYFAFLGSALRSLLLAPAFPLTKDQLPDLTGHVWIVTGATGGIGIEIAKGLARQNAKVWLVGRSESKMVDALAAVRTAAPNASNIDSFLIDFNDLATVKPGVKKFLDAETRIDGIVHNAGMLLAPQGATTAQGIEQTFGVNVVAPFLLQRYLDPLFVANPGSRIIWMSSDAHSFASRGGVALANLDRTDLRQPKQYAESKAACYILAVQWTKHHPDAQVKSLAAHPGLIASDLYRTTPGIVSTIVSPLYYSPEKGAESSLWAAFVPEIDNNEYCVPFGRPGLVRPDVRDAAYGDTGAQLWDWLKKKTDPFI